MEGGGTRDSKEDMAVVSDEYEYDVALSFAGENRAVVERFATLLKAQGLKVFYDTWEQASLWGRNLYQHLDEVYSKKARFCVMFLSTQYAAKAWTNHGNFSKISGRMAWQLVE